MALSLSVRAPVFSPSYTYGEEGLQQHCRRAGSSSGVGSLAAAQGAVLRVAWDSKASLSPPLCLRHGGNHSSDFLGITVAQGTAEAPGQLESV